ncbi:uncharacterized protein EURHEDRAFT_78918 [Aspergillus ruber CBS 135680]|uniref:Uncharacterized protein n=1 Tax=Aspergillus ruber (strain CBS 135680) TaxID=1388766 RepID=A0A017SC40_ASPRC|nr:uncharacterized protein EURHEDRAFT_78918 [Aspergillus ruber CBS 135680]EYE94578.1 hypothetical protein EURHEDRAFT_78918 [Aspergillus ruber CBS 135680]
MSLSDARGAPYGELFQLPVARAIAAQLVQVFVVGCCCLFAFSRDCPCWYADIVPCRLGCARDICGQTSTLATSSFVSPKQLMIIPKTNSM